MQSSNYVNKREKIFIHGCGFHSAMGQTKAQIHQCLKSGISPDMLTTEHSLNKGNFTIVGKVTGALPQIPTQFINQNTRNNRLALSALLQIEPLINHAKEKYGNKRIAVVIGTSTSGISDGELAFKTLIEQGTFPKDYHYHQQELGNLCEFISDYYSLEGPSFTISTACSSSGKAFISARNMLRANLADAVIVGGCDTLCQLTLNGFNALEAISSSLCQPFSVNRDGINIGEAAAFMLLSKDKSDSNTPLALLGVGESSDAHHISAPHPEGLGAEQSMANALNDAGLSPQDIGYINAHGTATKLNDAMEAKAIYRLFQNQVPVSSSKHLTGHTLGAASATEAALCLHLLQYDLPLPIQNSTQSIDPQLAPIQLVQSPIKLNKPAILSNSFAFGGNNVSLIFGTHYDK